MRSFVCKIGLILIAAPGFAFAVAGPPAGQAILNSPIYQRNSQMWVDTVTVQGILQLPYSSSTPPLNQCTESSQTGRIFIVSSTTAGGARIWICEGINGWQVKNSTSGGGGSGIPGGTDSQFQYNNAGAFAGSANLTTDGSTITATQFAASTITVSSLATFLSVSSTTWNSVSTVTFNDGVLVDMSNINDSNIGEGLLVPRASDGCVNAIRDGSVCWDTTNKLLYVGNGAGISSPFSYSLKTLNGAVIVSSPTTTLNFDSNQFSVTAPVSSTASISLNGSSVTMKANNFLPTNQIVQYTVNTASNVTSATFINTGLSGNITPRSSTSKIMITVSGILSCTGSGICYATISRNGSSLASSLGGFVDAAAPTNMNASMTYYDSPATTSPITYSVQTRGNGGTTTSFPGTDGGIYTTTAVLTLMEIAQ